MAERFSLSLLGQHVLAMRSDVATIKTDVAAIMDRLDHHQEELVAISGSAMRATGEHLAWASVQSQLRKPTARIEALKRWDG